MQLEFDSSLSCLTPVSSSTSSILLLVSKSIVMDLPAFLLPATKNSSFAVLHWEKKGMKFLTL